MHIYLLYHKYDLNKYVALIKMTEVLRITVSFFVVVFLIFKIYLDPIFGLFLENSSMNFNTCIDLCYY